MGLRAWRVEGFEFGIKTTALADNPDMTPSASV